MARLTCLTPASELRQVLREGRRNVFVTFKFYDTVYYRRVRLSTVRTGLDGGRQVDCMFTNGEVLTLVLPAPDSDSRLVEVNDSTSNAHLVIASNPLPPKETRALEMHLRLREEIILWGHPEPVDDGPYAQHPRLRQLPRDVREEVAEALGQVGRCRPSPPCGDTPSAASGPWWMHMP